jgi:hypothetical protein
VSAYVGFSTQADAIAFVAGLKRYFSKAYCQVRKAERLACEWEVKIRYFNETALETLMWTYAQDVLDHATVTAAQAKADIYPARLSQFALSLPSERSHRLLPDSSTTMLHRRESVAASQRQCAACQSSNPQRQGRAANLPNATH